MPRWRMEMFSQLLIIAGINLFRFARSLQLLALTTRFPVDPLLASRAGLERTFVIRPVIHFTAPVPPA